MFSPAFRLALERTLHDDITPEALETVFRASMRKITDAKKCRTGINLSKNLLIAKIMHKTRNIIIAAKKDQEATAAASAVPPATSPPPAVITTPTVPSGPRSPPPPASEKTPLVESRSEPSSKAIQLPPAPASPALRLRLSPTEPEMPAVDENVAPISPDGPNQRICASPRLVKRSHTWCSGSASEHSSTFWSDSPPASKVARMEVEDQHAASDPVYSNCCVSPSMSTSVAAPSAHASVTSPPPTGHLHFHNQQHHHHHHPPHSPPPTPTASALWTLCAKEQPSGNPVAPVIYSPYHQRISLPLTTCPI